MALTEKKLMSASSSTYKLKLNLAELNTQQEVVVGLASTLGTDRPEIWRLNLVFACSGKNISFSVGSRYRVPKIMLKKKCSIILF